jgi:hypothetical protein
MTSQEKALLVLKTSDLTFNQTNSVGIANATGTQCTWNNINLRVLLGNLYDKYNRFNLSLNTFTTGPLIGVVSDADTGTYITLSGLPFVNNTYSVKNASLNTEAILGSVLWKPQSSSSTTTSFIGSIGLTALVVSPNSNGQVYSFTGSTSGASTTLTITGSVAIPTGSYLVGYGIVGFVTITGRTSSTIYTMSTAQTITAGTPITAIFPNNVYLSIGTVITGNGITAGTTITAQTGPYDYTVNNSQNIGLTPMIGTTTTTSAATTYCNDIKYYENSKITFTKNQDICNLTLNIRKTSNDALPTSTLPNMILIFDIYGCDEYRVDDITQARILK